MPQAAFLLGLSARAVPSTGTVPDSRNGRVAAQAGLLLLATLACHANGMRAPFLFDDPVPGTTLEFVRRQLVWGSFALNRALSGAETWSYHAFNVLVHVLCGLALLGVLRRGLALARPGRSAPGRAGLAFAVTLLWLVHPLQTGVVTYLSQRAESLASLAYLGTVYGYLRALDAPAPRRWQALALASFALGFLAKEIIATAPALLLLAEVALVPGAPRANLRRRWRFHAALILVGVVLFVLLGAPVLFRPESSSGFGHERFGPLEYARSQPAVILHYLRLTVWPHPLVFDYGWPVAQALRDWVPQGLAVLALLAATLVLLVRRSPLGFACAAFFVLLAPSSSIVPIRDLAFEHRMYLPLAPVLLVVALAVKRACANCCPRLPALLAGLAALALACLTVCRNRDYASAIDLWRTVTERAPANARGHTNLAAALIDAGETAEAEQELATALALHPRSAMAHRNLGVIAAAKNQLEKAVEHLQQSLALEESPAVRRDLGIVLRALGRAAEAEEVERGAPAPRE